MTPFTFLPPTATVKTAGAGSPTVFEIVNRSAGLLQVFYIDSAGQEVFYGSRRPGETYFQPSRSTDAWSVKDANGTTLFKFVSSQSGLITVGVGEPLFKADIVGTANDDRLSGTAGDDRFTVFQGDDTVSAGAGADQLNLPGTRQDYTLSWDQTTDTYTLNSPLHGRKTIIGVEAIRFERDFQLLELDRLGPLLKPEVVPILQNGPSATRVNLVFVAEGYTAAERDVFLADVRRFTQDMLGTGNRDLNDPFATYAQYFNVSAMFVPSRDSGYDEHLKGLKVDTAFDATSRFEDGRNVGGSTDRVTLALEQVLKPSEREMVAVLVNSVEYGGSGGLYAWGTSRNRFSSEIMLHELGHSFGGLDDEYVDERDAARNPLSDIARSGNVRTSPTDVPWAHWIGYTDALGTVGAYEGGFFRAQGVWRPTPDSKMRSQFQPFSIVHKELFIAKFYEAIGDYLSWSTTRQGQLMAEVPDPAVVKISWAVSGQTVGLGPTLDLNTIMSRATPVMATPIATVVSISTVDGSGMVRLPSLLSLSAQTERIPVLLGSGLPDQFSGTNAGDLIFAGDGSDLVLGLGGTDHLHGQAGTDTLQGGGANDTVDGGSGLDVVRFEGPLSRYERSRNGADWLIRDRTGDGGQDVLLNVERLAFDDRHVALDLDRNEAAGQAILLIGAVLGRDLVRIKTDLLGTAISLFDQGFTLPVLAGALMRLPIWAGTLTASDSNADRATYLLTRVNGRTPSASEVEAAVSLMERESAGALLAQLATSDANVAQVDLIGLASTGYEFPVPPST